MVPKKSHCDSYDNETSMFIYSYTTTVQPSIDYGIWSLLLLVVLPVSLRPELAFLSCARLSRFRRYSNAA